jgi:hypothetical protein
LWLSDTKQRKQQHEPKEQREPKEFNCGYPLQKARKKQHKSKENVDLKDLIVVICYRKQKKQREPKGNLIVVIRYKK